MTASSFKLRSEPIDQDSSLSITDKLSPPSGDLPPFESQLSALTDYDGPAVVGYAQQAQPYRHSGLDDRPSAALKGDF